MRLGMIDDGVVIHVLPARADIEAVQCTLAAFTVQRRARILARQQSAKSDRRGVNTRGTSQVELYRAHVVGRLAFLLYLCILDHRTLAGHNLRDSVGEVGSSTQTEVALHQSYL